MSVFLSDEWFKKLENSAPELVSNEFSIISQYEISGTEQGKIRFFIVIESGQIKEVSKGKHQNADCVVTVKSSEGLKIHWKMIFLRLVCEKAGKVGNKPVQAQAKIF